MPLIKQINQNYQCTLKRENIQFLLDFTLLWNLFELKYFNKFFKVKDIQNHIHFINQKINTENVNYLFDYFKDRYIDNKQGNNLFNKLRIPNGDKTNIQTNLIKGNNKLYTNIYIISRFRNNLFHGVKEIQQIENQKDNFENANCFLASTLGLTDNNATININ